MKSTYTLFILSIIISCSSTKHLPHEQIIGTYISNDIFYGVSEEIELKANQGFEYNWDQGLLEGSTFGKWKREGNYIILNSNKQVNEVPPFEIIETKKYKSEILTLKVLNPNNEGHAFAKCALKKDTIILSGKITDLEGRCRFDKVTADSLIISAYGYNTIRIPLDSTFSSLTLKLVEDFDTYRYFTNEKWKFKKGRLYDTSKRKGHASRKYYYQKIK
ncbi:hypothetical protein [Lishizhenia sp.]|uniref:hypothetical protein n=1 Tax=Lishizhenia sp. TaxID=2497594 RepID=UPI00299E0E04|nr:hypothetical protein [Lishizhenia sp.]MDX1447013.1 hypothetical protein [Lishizhenia sp.]